MTRNPVDDKKLSHKIIVHPTFEHLNAFKGDILWHFDFQQSSMICIGHNVGGHTLALQQKEVIHSFKNHILVT